MIFFDKLGEYIRIIQKNVYLCLVRNSKIWKKLHF